MREKLKKMREDVWHGPCYTNADVAIMEDICKKLPDAEILEPVTFVGISDGKRNLECLPPATAMASRMTG